MFKNRYLAVVSIALLLILSLTASQVWPQSPAPEPFGQYIVYSAAGVYDASVPPPEGDLTEWFHFEVMGRSQEEFEAERDEADAYFRERFGDLYTGELEAFGVDPRDEYRAYYISGMYVPPEGFVVRDGGFRTMLTNGGMVVYGDYNIKLEGRGNSPDPEPLIIHYQSADPIFGTDHGMFFRCEVSTDAFEDYGGGLAQGVSAPETLPDGRTVANIRNVLTFPGLGLEAQQ